MREDGKAWRSSYEATFHKKDGSILDVEVKTEIIEFLGKPATIAIIRDITERRQAEEALKQKTADLQSLNKKITWKNKELARIKEEAVEQEALSRSRIENLILGFYVGDMDGVLIAYNSEFCKILGLNPAKDHTGMRMPTLLVDPKDREIYMQELTQKGFVKNYVIQAHNVQGKALYLQLNTNLIKNEHGEPVGTEGTFLDITDNMLAEQKLDKSEQLTKAITESATDAIISIDHSGLVTSWNNGAVTMFGYTPAELIGSNLERIIPPEHISGHSKGVSNVAQGGKEKLIGKQIEIEAIRKDGARFPTELGLSSWTAGGERNFTAIIRDVTERKAAELKVYNALDEAKHANEVKDQFIANISHEIRTPLNSIIGFSDLFFQRYAHMVAPKDQDIFGYIAKASERLMSTVDSIMNISLLKSGAVSLHAQELNLKALLTSIIDKLSPRAEEKNLTLRTSFPHETIMIYADEYCVQQAIHHLVDNAIKFTYKGHVALEIIDAEDNITFTVLDTGIGISESYKHHIFAPYSQESEGFTKNYQGIGLGLALAKRYLDLNNISLDLKTQSGEGSTFTLIFPKHQGT